MYMNDKLGDFCLQIFCVNRKYPPLKDKFEEKIGDSKGVIRRHNSISEDKQYNDHPKDKPITNGKRNINCINSCIDYLLNNTN